MELEDKTSLARKTMLRTLLTAVAACALAASPAMGQISQKQQKEIEKRGSTGVANSDKQLGGLKRDRQISQQTFRHAHNRMPVRHHHYAR
jgi:hypothetical protein